LKPFLFILSSLLILLLSGCYTQVTVLEDTSHLSESKPAADTVAYVYFHLNHLVPIPGWDPAPFNPEPAASVSEQFVPQSEQGTPEAEQTPQETQTLENWPSFYFSYPVIIPSDPSTDPANGSGQTGVTDNGIARPQTASLNVSPSPVTPPQNVRRASGLQRGTVIQNSSPQSLTRNSGATRPEGR
jgi:hypothetical protein